MSVAQASFIQSSTLPTGPYWSPHPTSSSDTYTNLKTSLSNVYRSPFDTTAYKDVAPYTSVQGDGVATFDVTGHVLKLIWGSPDDYNNLSLYSGLNGTGKLLETINGSKIGTADGTGFSYVTITEAAGFNSFVLSNNPSFNSFEISTVTVSSVPLPASLPMFGTAILGLGAVRYGMKRNKAAVAA